MRTLIAVLLACAPAFAAGAEDDIKAAEKAWAAAVVARDEAALDKTYASSLIYAHSTGAVESKKEYMDRLRTGVQRYDAVTHESTRVVPYGDAAVAHSIMRMTGTSNGRPFNDHIMMIHLWVKQGGRWQLAAHQTTKIP